MESIGTDDVPPSILIPILPNSAGVVASLLEEADEQEDGREPTSSLLDEFVSKHLIVVGGLETREGKACVRELLFKYSHASRNDKIYTRLFKVLHYLEAPNKTLNCSYVRRKMILSSSFLLAYIRGHEERFAELETIFDQDNSFAFEWWAERYASEYLWSLDSQYENILGRAIREDKIRFTSLIVSIIKASGPGSDVAQLHQRNKERDTALLLAARFLRLNHLALLLPLITPALLQQHVDALGRNVLHLLLMRVKLRWQYLQKAGKTQLPTTHELIDVVSLTIINVQDAVAFILAKDSYGFNCLDYAVDLGTPGVIALLLSRVDMQTEIARLLEVAIKKNKPDLVCILANKPLPSKISEANLIMLAVSSMCAKSLNALLSIGNYASQINTPVANNNDDGQLALPLQIAVSLPQESSAVLVRALLRKGARVLVPAPLKLECDNMFALAARCGNADVLRLLLDEIVVRQPLLPCLPHSPRDNPPCCFKLGVCHFASNPLAYGIRESLCVDCLLESPFRLLVNTPEADSGLTPLALAMQNGDIEICKKLLLHGASPMQKLFVSGGEQHKAQFEAALLSREREVVIPTLSSSESMELRTRSQAAHAALQGLVEGIQLRGKEIAQCLSNISSGEKHLLIAASVPSSSTVRIFLTSILALLKTSRQLTGKVEWGKSLFRRPTSISAMLKVVKLLQDSIEAQTDCLPCPETFPYTEVMVKAEQLIVLLDKNMLRWSTSVVKRCLVVLQIFAQVDTLIHTQKHTHICTDLHIRTHIDTHTHTHTYIHTLIHAQTHTYKHFTHTHTVVLLGEGRMHFPLVRKNR